MYASAAAAAYLR
jgi:hypothetical protein